MEPQSKKSPKNSSKNSWIVHKFGGTSVADSGCYKKVAKIIRNERQLKWLPDEPRKAVVVSAMSKVTNRLFELVELARQQDSAYIERLDELKQTHLKTIHELFTKDTQTNLIQKLESDSNAIADVLKAVSLSKSYSEQTLEWVAGHGELWSAAILSSYLSDTGLSCRWLDARLVLVVAAEKNGPVVDWKISRQKLYEWLRDDSLLVITGYIASTPDSVATTLKRNGSDYSASIFGALLDAASITIWTDVDGVLSADPRRVPEAVVLDELSYQEAMELAYFGAKVIHPHTMAPALQKNIPIWIRNTFNPEFSGTKIYQPTKTHQGGKTDTISNFRSVKGFATVEEVALVNLEGTGMIGVPGIASRLFGSLREVGVSVIMISQASSEHSICFAVPENQGELARTTVEEAFYLEIQHGQIQSVELLKGNSILAAVGDNMVEVPGVAAKFFLSLVRAQVNVRAIAQGSSERNISVVVAQTDATRALRAVHAGFFLSAQTISIGIIGMGAVGLTLLKQLEAQNAWLRSQFNIDLRVRGIANSRKMWLADQRLSFSDWTENSIAATPLDMDAFTKHIKAEHLPHSVIIDCTSSEAIAALYAGWLSAGIPVITPNKKANSGPLKTYRKLCELTRDKGSHYLYEATVGAGLPIITTLRDLILTGDKIFQVEGILSGTLSYIFNNFGVDVPFSSIVRDACKQGYTEPDPRDDLSGLDVARKLVILGREMGLDIELKDVAVLNLVPPTLQMIKGVADFLDELPSYDEKMTALQTEAGVRNEVLRYVGIVNSEGKASVELKCFSRSHPFARVSGTDNIIAFTTARYCNQPLIVQGPGAGPEVTAGGIFADLLRLVSYVRASL